MAYTPLTKEQYQKAIDSGFTGQQIIENEKRRKTELSDTAAPPVATTPVGNFITGAAKEAAALPFQLVGAGRSLAGLVGKGLQKVPISGVQSYGKKVAEFAAAPTGIAKTLSEVPQALKPEGTAQKIGAATTSVAEMFTPTGIEAKAVSLLPKAPRIAKAIGGALEYGGKAFLQTGDVKKSAETGAIAGLAAPIAGVIKGVGKGAAEFVVPTSAKEAGLIQSYKAAVPFWKRVLSGITGEALGGPTTAAKTSFEKGLVGTESMIGVQAKKAGNNLWNKLIQPALNQSKTKVNMPAFLNGVKADIIKEVPEVSRQNSLLEAIDAMIADYKNVGEVKLPELQKFKEGWAAFVPEKSYRGKQIAGAFNEVRSMVADKARTTIYDSLGPEVKKAYFDYGNLKGLQELGKTAMTGSKLKGGFGSFWSAVKDMAITPVGTLGGQTVYKVGEGVELIGKQGAKVVSDIIPDPEQQ